MSRVDRARTVLRALVHEARAEHVTFMAGSIAYHAFVSLLPLLLLLLAVLSAVGGGTLQDALIEFTQVLLTPGAGEVLIAELEQASNSAGISVLGFGLLLWGTLRIFRGIDTAFSDIYETDRSNTFADKIVDGLLVLVPVAAAIGLGVVLEARVLGETGVAGGWLAGRLLLVAGLGIALFPIYYVFPDVEGMTVRETLPGLAFVAVALTAFESLFGLYVEVSSRQPRRSALAGILVFLTWLYVSGLVLLVGAVVNAVLANRSADVDIEPVIGGKPDPEGTQEPAVAGRLRDLESGLADAESVRIEVDGETVPVPPPDGVAVETGESETIFADDPELRVWWSEPTGEQSGSGGESDGPRNP